MLLSASYIVSESALVLCMLCCSDVQLVYFAGDCVLAEWKDERYYQATVVSMASNSVDVKFADESVMSVHRQSLAKCSQIPVGCTVLAKTAQSDWYRPAVVQAYYCESQQQQPGYTVLFTGQTSHTQYALIR